MNPSIRIPRRGPERVAFLNALHDAMVEDALATCSALTWQWDEANQLPDVDHTDPAAVPEQALALVADDWHERLRSVIACAEFTILAMAEAARRWPS